MKRLPVSKKVICIILLLMMLAGCATTKITSFSKGDPLKPETEGERRLWHASIQIENALKKSDQVHKDQDLQNYLQNVMDRLYPEFKGKIHVNVLKAPILNAFALPNGGIYINTGLLAALENEAQVATILAHEGIHFINKHSARQRITRYNTIGVSWGLVLLGVDPNLTNLFMYSSIFGCSQHHENEADRIGYERLMAAGYDVREAPKTFRHLAMEAKANKVPEPFFFSTHPKLQTRIKNFEAYNASLEKHTGDVNAAIYQKHIADLRLIVLKEKIKAGKYESVIAVLTRNNLSPLYGDKGLFFLGEAYRLRNEDKDFKKAVDAYQKVEKSSPDFAPVYKSFGILYLKSKKYKKASEKFERYLHLDPHSPESAFVRQYLKQARSHLGEK